MYINKFIRKRILSLIAAPMLLTASNTGSCGMVPVSQTLANGKKIETIDLSLNLYDLIEDPCCHVYREGGLPCDLYRYLSEFIRKPAASKFARLSTEDVKNGNVVKKYGTGGVLLSQRELNAWLERLPEEQTTVYFENGQKPDRCELFALYLPNFKFLERNCCTKCPNDKLKELLMRMELHNQNLRREVLRVFGGVDPSRGFFKYDDNGDLVMSDGPTPTKIFLYENKISSAVPKYLLNKKGNEYFIIFARLANGEIRVAVNKSLKKLYLCAYKNDKNEREFKFTIDPEEVKSADEAYDLKLGCPIFRELDSNLSELLWYARNKTGYFERLRKQGIEPTKP